MDPVKVREAKKKIGSTFALTVLLQKRCQELVRGASRLIETDHKNPIDVALEEVLQGKIWLGERITPLPPPEPVVAADAKI
jgi:DNA-directed RNA polymerase omega subunit